MYRLLNVPGINTYDTLYFPTLAAQKQYFDSKVYGQPIDAYYPPLYSNVIKIQEENLTLDEFAVNYLSLEFNGKNYYYFITDIKYIAECIYELTIVMDTIQTFMFDFKKIGKVDRKSIERWNSSNMINRNYIRENLSQEDFELYSYDEYSTDWIFYVFAFSEIDNDTAISTKKPTNYKINNMYSTNGLFYFVLPIPKNKPVGTYQITCNNTTATLDFDGDVNAMISNPYCAYAYVMDSKIFRDMFNISVSTSGSITTATFTDKADGISYSSGENPFFEYVQSGVGVITIPALKIGTMNCKFMNYTYTSSLINFSKNTNTEEPFNPEYIPYLLDENYLKFEFGERLMTSTFPLHRLYGQTNNQWFVLQARIDVESGFRNYRILENSTAYDEYITITTVNTQPSITLNTDSWQSYYANNRANYTMGISNNIANIVWSNFTGTSSNVAGTMIKSNSLVNSSKVQMANANLEAAGQADMDKAAIIRQMGSNTSTNTAATGSMYKGLAGFQAKMGLANTVVQIANYSHNLQIVRENAISTPNYVSQGNNGLNDLFDGTFNTIIKESFVRDLLEVAHKIEFYGYRVNEYHKDNSTTSGFTDFRIRHYYNIVEMSSLIIQTDITIGEQYKTDFITRLRSGIRLWTPGLKDSNNREYQIGDALLLDNVEENLL